MDRDYALLRAFAKYLYKLGGKIHITKLQVRNLRNARTTRIHQLKDSLIANVLTRALHLLSISIDARMHEKKSPHVIISDHLRKR